MRLRDCSSDSGAAFGSLRQSGEGLGRWLRLVESRKGAVASRKASPVSLPRSSNRTCGFPASGFPTGFIVRPTTVVQRQNPEPPKDQIAGEAFGSAAGYLMPPSEEMSDASADVVINRFVCPAACSIAEIGRPTAQ